MMFRAYVVDPHYMGILLHVKNDTFNSSRNYSHECSYTDPSHSVAGEDISVQITFICDIVVGQNEQEIGISYSAETTSIDGTKKYSEYSFARDDVNISIANGRSLITKAVKKNRSWLGRRFGGVLGSFWMDMEMLNNASGPVSRFYYFIEDNKRFDGSGDNPFLRDVFSLRYFTVNLGDLIEEDRQAFIYCSANGYKIPDVDVYKLANDGSEIPLTYPKFVLRGRYSVKVQYIINYPTADDAGSYVCRARLGGIERESTKYLPRRWGPW